MSTTRRGRREAERRPLPPCWLEAQLPYSSVLFDFLDTYKVRGITVLCSARRWSTWEGRRTHGSPRLARALPTLRSTGLHHAFPRSPHSLRALSHLSALSLPMLLARRAR